MLLCLISYNKYISSYTVNNMSSFPQHFTSEAVELIKEETVANTANKLGFLASDDFSRRTLSHDDYLKHVLLRYKFRSFHRAKEALAEFRRDAAKKYMTDLVIAEVEFMYNRDFFVVIYFKLFWVLAGFFIIKVKIRFWSAYIRDLLENLVSIENAYLRKASSRHWELSKDLLHLVLWSEENLQRPSDQLGPEVQAFEVSLADSFSEPTDRDCYASDRNDTEDDAGDPKAGDRSGLEYNHIADESCLKTEADASLLV